MKSSKFRDLFRFVIVVVIVLLLNVISSFEFFRIDLTAEKRYSLSEATINLLESFDDVLVVKVYLEGDFPSGFQRLQRETRQMLDEFRAYNSNIEYRFVNPSGSADEKINRELQQQLQYKGLRYYDLQVKEADGQKTQRVFPGAIMNYGSKERAVNLLQDQMGVGPEAQINASVQNLEYSLANAIRGLVRTERPSIAFVEGQGELEPRFIADFALALNQNYQVERFNLRKFKSDSTGQDISLMQQQQRLNRFDALILAKPTKAFTEIDKFLLDQYAMRGGKIIWLLDAVHAEMDSLSQKSQFLAYPIYDRLNIDDLLFRYGARINTNIVTDAVAAGVSDQREINSWVYFPMVMPQVDHPITKDLNAVKLMFPSSVDTIKAAGVEKTFLLKSSPYTRVVATPHMVKLQTLYNPPKQESFSQKEVPMAVLLEGEFTSAFKNRITPKQGASEKISLLEKSNSTQMLVVADGDIVRNQINIVNPNMERGIPLPLGYDQFTGTQYGNKDFLLNAVDYMLDESNLIDIRSRELKIRLMDLNRLNNNRLLWQLLNTLGPILLVGIFAVIYLSIRKRKYS